MRAGHGIVAAMKRLALACLLWLLAGCATRSQGDLYWNVRDLALVRSPTVALLGPKEQIILQLNTQTIQKLMLAHLRISRTANVQTDLLLVEGDDPNAFAGVIRERRAVVITTGMVKLIGDDIDEFAALLGHETAHWAKGHIESGQMRAATIQGIGTLIGVGLGVVGVPGAGYITGLGANIIEASYSRDDEREADAASIDYMLASGFDPAAAVRLHEKVLKLPSDVRIYFLSGHPSGEERIENLKKIIEAKKADTNKNQQIGNIP